MKSKICDICCVSPMQILFTFISFCSKIMDEYERFPGSRPAMSRIIVYIISDWEFSNVIFSSKSSSSC